MLFLRTLSRVVGVALMLALALICLGIALYCLDGLIRLGSARPDRLLHLTSVRHHVGHFLAQLAAAGPTASLALAGGVVAVLIGLLLLVGTLRSTKQRHVILRSDHTEGTLAARPGILRAMSQTLAEQAVGATAIKRPRLKASRRGSRGRLTVSAARSRTSDPDEVTAAITSQLEPITGSFGLRPRVRVHDGESGERVQ